MNQYDTWLRALGTRRRDLSLDRGLPFKHIVRLEGDFSTFDIDAVVKASPDTTPELATFTVSAPSFADGFTSWELFLPAATTLTLPAANPGTGRVEFIFDVLLFDAARVDPRRLFGGVLTVVGFVTELS